ncbi:MAG: DnaB-like helicase N-terminal domain-containing protein, partial [Anaerolineales bacterium]
MNLLHFPNAIALESIIGTLLVNPEFINELDLSPEDFYLEVHRWIFEAARNLANVGSWDLQEMISELERMGRFKETGGSAQLAALLNYDLGPTMAKGYIARVKKLSTKRKAIKFGSSLVKNIDKTNMDPEHYLRELEDILKPVSNNGDLLSFIPKTTWTVRELYETEFPEPKYLVPGIIPFGLIILAGRPKVGKSILALQITVAAGSGGIVFGRKVERRRVLLYAIEDGPIRLD